MKSYRILAAVLCLLLLAGCGLTPREEAEQGPAAPAESAPPEEASAGETPAEEAADDRQAESAAEEEPAALPELPCRRLRLDAFAQRELSREERAALRKRKKESRALLSAATETLAQAKALHDELEAVYRPHVDFSGLDALAEEHIRRLNAPGWTPAR